MNLDALSRLETPAALIDAARMARNIARMQQRAQDLGVRLRPHVKTSKSLPVTRAQLAAGAQGITVSTLKEAGQFFADGITDILYAVGIVPSKLPTALALRRQGCALKLITDNLAAARSIVAFGQAQDDRFEVWLEIDTDGHRSGLRPDADELLAVGQALHAGGQLLGGVMTHAGASYAARSHAELVAIAEQERAGVVQAAQRLRAAGLPCDQVSLGSTPTALRAAQLEGVTELRAGVYVFFDLVMRNLAVCRTDELALSVLATVIGHQVEKGWVLVDAGWMAMSRDRGTAQQACDFGYGQVCGLDGTPLPGWRMSGANQEHGILSWSPALAPAEELAPGSAAVPAGGRGPRGDHGAPSPPGETGAPDLVLRFPLGSRLRILPNHACATAAQFSQYQVIAADGGMLRWDRFNGW